MKKIYITLLITISVAIASSGLYAQTPLGEEFSYQGELNDANGNPHDGVFDFQFIAYDTQTNNTGINLGVYVAEDVTVTNGIFTTQIDYSLLGDQPFVGNKVWLEISVRIGTTTGGYQQLLPRQQVTATPYANYATIAEMVGSNAVGTNEIIDDSIGATDIGANAVGTSEIDSAQVQRRVTTTCPAGQFIQSVNQDGTAVCVAETGGITSVTSADIVDGTIGAIDIDNTEIQQRIGTVCSGGRSVRSVNTSGVAACIFPTPNDNSVTSAKVADGSIVAVDVDTSQIQQRITGSCIFPEYLTSITQAGDVVCARMEIPIIRTLDTAEFAGLYTSIAIGADGNPIISYYDNDSVFIFSDGSLKIVKCNNQSCSNTQTPRTLDATFDVGRYTSIVIGADDNPIISYYDGANGDLKVVKCNNQSCSSTQTPRILDAAGDVGRYTSIAIDAIGADNNPIISYWDATNKNLKVVKCNNQSCSSTQTPRTLDATGDVGRYTSIAIGTDGNPIISYYDSANGNLKTVRCVTPSCSLNLTSVTVDSNGDVGRHTSIAIGADGNPIISYYDNTDDDLKVVKCSNQSCSSKIVFVFDFNGVGEFTSIAIGADGNPIISYYDKNNGDLKVLKCRSPSCGNFLTPLRTLDATGNVGSHTSIAIGADGNPIISYYDASIGDLKVYSCGDESCAN